MTEAAPEGTLEDWRQFPRMFTQIGDGPALVFLSLWYASVSEHDPARLVSGGPSAT